MMRVVTDGVPSDRVFSWLQLAIDWAYEQKIIPHKMSVDSLFHKNTADLIP